jgi:hypothetical protein
MSKKKILLVEPAYKTKYPPLGLMKISTYHKRRGDDITFVKGCSTRVRGEFWDKVYISTLFTYTWKETVKTINFYKDALFYASSKIYVGGILANILPEELFDATGIMPVEGLLDDSRKLDQDDDTIIEELPPDYEILKQVENNDFSYSHKDAYIGYATRGCVRTCEFCVVNSFEPEYIPYISISKIIENIKSESCEKQNLLLMDNNVLASKHFDMIIDDIKNAGFYKGATFGKTRKKRIVDFNQGLDARLLTEKKMKRLSEIPLEPMRIAFDDIKYKKTYIKAVRLAHKYEQRHMSNYILFNFKDTPEDFYERLEINILLNEEFAKAPFDSKGTKTVIYSFPMRYFPFNAKSRVADTGNKYWNKRYLRGLQVILNVMKGSVMTGSDFFYQAFGENPEEFKSILLMPDEFIRNRVKPNWQKIKDSSRRLMPYVKKWMKDYQMLSNNEKRQLVGILAPNDKSNVHDHHDKIRNNKIKKLLGCHLNTEKFMNGNKKCQTGQLIK